MRHALPAFGKDPGETTNQVQRQVRRQTRIKTKTQVPNQNRQRDAGAGLTPAQMDFFHSTNAAAVSSVVDAIESQVERLLPDGISKSARNRVVGEIYRELDYDAAGKSRAWAADARCISVGRA